MGASRALRSYVWRFLLLSLIPFGLSRAAYVSDATFAWIQKETGFETKELGRMLDVWRRRADRNLTAWRKQYPTVVSYIKDNNLKVGCEVGVAFGTQSVAILKEAGVDKLYSIDPYKAYRDPFSAGITPKHWDTLMHLVRSRLLPFGERSEFIRAASLEAVVQFEDGSLDFVYLDGDHNYGSIKKDLAAWVKKVRSGGLLMGDDYTQQFPGVRKAIDEFVRAHKLKVKIERRHTFIIWVP